MDIQPRLTDHVRFLLKLLLFNDSIQIEQAIYAPRNRHGRREDELKGKMELNDKGESERTGCGERVNKPITNKAIVKKRKRTITSFSPAAVPLYSTPG